ESLRGEDAAERVGEVVPLAREQIEVDAQQGEHQDHEAAREEDVGETDRAREERVRSQQRNAEEEVVVQQLLVPGLLRGLHAAGKSLLRERAGRREELARGEEVDELL